MVELMTSDLLSPNIYALFMTGTPRYLSVFLRSIICSVAVLAATNSEPCVAVSTVACVLENQSVVVVLTKCNTAVTDFPPTMLWSRLASRNVVVITLFPVEKSVFSIWIDLFLCRSIQLLVLSYAEMFVYMYLSQLMSTFTNYLKVHHLLDGFFIP